MSVCVWGGGGKGGGMVKAWVGYSSGQDFINILQLVLCKQNS